MQRILVNVCGTSRSGSTMLDLMLGNGPKAFSCGEVYSWFRPWRRHHFRLDCPCGLDPCPIWKVVGGVPESLFHSELARHLDLDFVVDSSKDLCWVIDSLGWSQKSGMGVCIVLPWKHPLDLAHSQWKRGKGLMAWRNEFVLYHRRFLELKLPFVSIQYRSLVRKPASVLSRLCSIIGMYYFNGKERFWENESHHLFGSSSVREQVLRGESEIRFNDPFPSEFKKLISEISRRITVDGEVQEILQVLNSTEVDTWGNSKLPNSLLSQGKPWWYYAQRLRRAVKRYFPDPWPEPC